MSQDSIYGSKKEIWAPKIRTLIGGSVVGQDKGAVVCPNIGDVAVLSTAKFRIIIACLHTFRSQRWFLWVKVEGYDAFGSKQSS